jgi:hypothetical protein
MRPTTSVVDPGVKGTIARIGLVGQFCADASRGSAAAASAAPDH